MSAYLLPKQSSVCKVCRFQLKACPPLFFPLPCIECVPTVQYGSRDIHTNLPDASTYAHVQSHLRADLIWAVLVADQSGHDLLLSTLNGGSICDNCCGDACMNAAPDGHGD